MNGAAFKLSGGGNDFLALVGPERDPTAEEIAAWCRRGHSLGADGVFTLRRDDVGAVMHYWNADGAPASLCLNGTRCAARLAFALGWAESALRITTGAGPLVARRGARDDEVEVEVPPPTRAPEERAPTVDWRTYVGLAVEVGVPHFVLFWPESLATAPVGELGAALRHHPDFGPAGTNVDFVRFPAPQRMEIRSFERGVEGETLACGTGILAGVAAGLARGRARLPVRALTLGGFELVVAGEAEGSPPRTWSLAGDARLLARLDLLTDSTTPPPAAPNWSAD